MCAGKLNNSFLHSCCHSRPPLATAGHRWPAACNTLPSCCPSLLLRHLQPRRGNVKVGGEAAQAQQHAGPCSCGAPHVEGASLRRQQGTGMHIKGRGSTKGGTLHRTALVGTTGTHISPAGAARRRLQQLCCLIRDLSPAPPPPPPPPLRQQGTAKRRACAGVGTRVHSTALPAFLPPLLLHHPPRPPGAPSTDCRCCVSLVVARPQLPDPRLPTTPQASSPNTPGMHCPRIGRLPGSPPACNEP